MPKTMQPPVDIWQGLMAAKDIVRAVMVPRAPGPPIRGFFSSQNPLTPLPALLLRVEQHQGLTYQRDAVRRQPFALRSSCFNIQIRRVNNPIWTTKHSQMDES